MVVTGALLLETGGEEEGDANEGEAEEENEGREQALADCAATDGDGERGSGGCVLPDAGETAEDAEAGAEDKEWKGGVLARAVC